MNEHNSNSSPGCDAGHDLIQTASKLGRDYGRATLDGMNAATESQPPCPTEAEWVARIRDLHEEAGRFLARITPVDHPNNE